VHLFATLQVLMGASEGSGSNGQVLGNLVPYPTIFDVAWASGLGLLFSTTSRHVAGQHVTM